MSKFRMQFSGDVRKPAVKDIGGKKAIEFQLMSKNYAPAGQEASFTWLRITIFGAQEWQVAQCAEGKFVAGSGEFTLRSYEKDGQKRQSAEVRCQSFDLDAPFIESATAPQSAGPQHTKPRIPTSPAISDEPNW